MKAKKLLVLMLSLLVLIGVIVGMSSCGGDKNTDTDKDTGKNEGCKHAWSEASCTEPQTCYFCGAKTGEPLGHLGGTCGTVYECQRCHQLTGASSTHKWSAATCTKPKRCTVCGAIEGEALGHTGGSATCQSPAICDRCHETYGSKSDHGWVDADCTDPKHCTVCGITDGKELGHKGGTATCTSQAVCEICNQPYGELSTHKWIDATCTEAKHCESCNATEGTALGHKGGTATCTSQAVCDVCHEAYGEIGTHKWIDATCTEAKHCENCTATEGEALGHKGGTPTCEGPAECDVCGEPYGEAGTHKGGIATCTKGAVCSTCMQEYTAPLSHSWTNATCTEAKTCENCGATEGAALGHSGGNATCTTLAVCNVCGESYGNTAGHDYSAKNTDASYVKERGDCTTTAIYYYSCSVCGDRDENNTFEGETAVGHAWGEYETANGVHTRTCSVCHTPESGSCLFDAESGKGSAATCLNPAVCSVCEREFGEASGHDWNGGVITTQPTCTASGVKTYTCNNCNGTKTESVAPTGHSFGAYTVTTPATCTTAGEKTAECACGEIKTESILATGHTPGAAATCETAQVCTACSLELAPATGHNRVITSSTPASCTACQVNYYACSGCGEETDEEVGSPLGHESGVDPIVENAVGNPCEKIQKYACNRCGEIVKAETVINHVKWTAAITTPATCTEEGVKTLTCNDCGTVETEAIEIDTALGHKWDDGVTADGITTYTCTGCQETKTVKVITSGDKVSGSDLDNELQVGEDTNFNLDEGIKDLIGDQEVTVSSDKITGDDKLDLGLKPEELEQIGDNPVYNFTIEGENGFISDFENNFITITLPYTLSEGEDVDSIAIWFINDEGEVEAIKAVYNDGYVTFQTNHFSSYTVTRLTPKQRCNLYGHSSSFTYVQPTCTENGYVLEFCIRCGYSNKSTPKEYKAFGHSYTELTVPATCTVAGSTTYTCSTCTYSYTVVLNPLNHTYVLDREVIATCMNPGAKYYVCEREGCNASYTETIAQLDHDMAETVTAPTCGNGGYTTHYCENEGCTYSYVDSYTAPLDHDYEIWLEWDGDKVPNGNPNNGKYGHCTVKLICKNCTHEYTLTDDELHMSDEITLPTCNDKGNKKYIVRFTANGKVHEYQIKDETFFGFFRHEFGEGFNKYDDTYHWSECKCGAKENEAKHKLGKGVVTKVATCTAEGEITYSCECGYTKTETIPKTSHSFSSGWTTDESAHWKVCSVCETVEAKADHSFGSGKVTKAPTCATEGEMTYRCSCGYVKTEAIPTTDEHKYNKKDLKFDEYTHWYECRNCHGKVEEAAHSDSEAVVITPATCTESGLTSIRCSCGFDDKQTVAPLGHSFTNYTSNGDAKCGIDGTKTALCDNGCGETNTVTDEGSALDHIFTNYTSNGDAKCGIDGTKTALCDNGCGETNTVTDKGSALDHIFTNYTSNGDAKCGIDGTKTALCDNGCGETNTVTDEGSALEHVFTNYVSNGDATCGADGTKTAKCDNGCGETNTVTDEGSALDHFAYETKVNKPATCTEDGEMLVICICGHSWTEVIPSEGGSHSYDKADYEYDDENHWYVCTACGEKVDLEAHSVAETVITNGTSCDDPSTKTEYCECGYELGTEVIPGGNHNLTETVTVDLGAYGVCGGGTFTYMSCMCGATKSFTMEEAENTFTQCDMDEISEDYGVDENGNQWMSMEMACSICGVHISANATATMEGCLIRAEYVYTFSINDEIIVDNLQFVMEQSNHNTVSDKLMLDEYCGGYIDVRRCQECGLITYVGDLNPKCNVEEPEITEKVVDGVTHYVMAATCPDCGLYFEMSQWKIDVSVCEYREYRKILVKDGDEIIIEYEDYSYYDNHQITEDFELLGETCEDGVKVTRKCSVCDYESTYLTQGHYRTEEMTVDLQEYGGCGGYIRGNYCTICETVVNLYEFNVKCEVDLYNGEQVEIDGILYTIIDTTCPKCGLHYEVKQWNEYESDSVCSYRVNKVTTISNADGVITTGVQWMYYNGHEFVRNYIYNGETCDEGYTVQVTCKNCDYYSEYQGKGHNYRYETYYFDEYGTCGGFIELAVCENCGIVEGYNSNLHCGFHYVDNDDNGYELYACKQCGLVRMEKYQGGEKDENCMVSNDMHIIFEFGDAVIVDFTYSEIYYQHNEISDYEMLGKTCEEGYRVYVTCADCGMSYGGYIQYGHDTEYVTIDLSEYGACGGTVRCHKCRICDKITNVEEIDLGCDMPEDGYGYYTEEIDGIAYEIEFARCPNCGLYAEVRSWSESLDGGSCTTVVHTQVTVTVNGNTVIDSLADYHREGHEFVEEYELMGENCEDGYYVIIRCKNCDYYDRYENWGHNFNHYSFKSGCGNYFEGEKCDTCGEWRNVEGEFFRCENPEIVEDSYEENGVTYYTIQSTCYDCGCVYALTEWEEYISDCVSIEGAHIIITLDGEVVVDYAETYEYNDHNYETHYEFYGEICSDGYTVYQTCTNCGDSSSYESYDHIIVFESINLSDYGIACGGHGEKRYCSACNEIFNAYVNSWCSWNYEGMDDQGNRIERCYNCGAVRVYRDERSEKDENCQVVITLTYSYYMDEIEVFSYSSTEYEVRHNYEETVTMFGDSCEDGYTVVGTCIDCGIGYERIEYSHQRKALLSVDFAAYGCCSHHRFIYYECYCGQISEHSWDSYNFSYDSITNTYSCHAGCGATIKVEKLDEFDGCSCVTETRYTLFIGNEEITRFSTTESYTKHSIKFGAAITDGFVSVYGECEKCGYTIGGDVESQIAELVYNEEEGIYCYEFEFTPEESGYYVIYSVANWDTYVHLYSIVDGNRIHISNDDDGGNSNNFKLNYYLEAGETYVYRIRNYSSDNSQSIPYVFTAATDEITCNHNFINYNILIDGSTNCDDGVVSIHACERCGYVDSYNDRYYHETYRVERIELSHSGICADYGYVDVWACVCGQRSHLSFSFNCSLESEWNSFYDENNVYHEICTERCSECGFTIVSDRYVSVDGCENSRIVKYTVSVGENVILSDYILKEEVWYNHEYVVDHYEFAADDNNCQSGVTVYRACKYCDATSEYYTTTHEHTIFERIELSEHGACGGFIEYRACPCGYINNIGANIYCPYSSENITYVDDNGVRHHVWTYTCAECGFVFVEDTYSVKEGCYLVSYLDYTCSINGEVLLDVDKANSSRSTDHAYQYEYVFDNTETMNCEDGVTIYVTCSDCGYSDSYYRNYHDYSTTYTKYDLDQYGACGSGSYVRLYSCPCGYNTSFNDSVYNCSMSGSYNYYTDDNGVYHEVYTRVCSECGLTIVRDRHTDQIGCDVYHTYTYTVSIGDTVIVDCFDNIYSRGSNHTYGIPTYTFNTEVENCESGVTLYYECTVCEYSYEQEYYNHNTILKSKLLLEDHGACAGGSYVEYYACPCDASSSISYSIYCMTTSTYYDYTDDNGIRHRVYDYSCSACGLIYSVDSYTVIEGCYRVNYSKYNFAIGETELLSTDFIDTGRSTYHNYQYEYVFDNTETMNCEDGVTIYVTCSGCSYTRNYYREYHDSNVTYTQYYLDQYGACSKDSYIRLYSCPCGYSKSFSNNIYNCSMSGSYSHHTDDNGVYHEIYTRVCSECGLTIVRDRYSEQIGCDVYNSYTYSVSIGDTVIVDGYDYVYSKGSNHTYGVPTYTFDTEVDNCTNGVTLHYACLNCDYSYDETRTYHSTILKERYDFADFGACGGYVEYHECPCGQEASVSYSNGCSNTNSTTEYYVDENGVSHNKETLICRQCGLLRVIDRYVVKEGCQRVTYASYRFTIGETDIFSVGYIVTNRSTYHNYQYEYVFDNAESMNCEDGVTINVTCADCDYTNSYYRGYHEYSNTTSYYYLSDYGVCNIDSYIYLRSCACGYSTYFGSNIYCSMSGSNEYYTDTNGVEHTIYTRVCNNCGLTIVRDSYTVIEGCKRVHYYDYSVSIGDEVIVDNFHHVNSRWEEHTYGIPTYTFNTADENCLGGVTYHYECTECDYSYDVAYTDHQLVRKEYYDLTEYGACGGYVEYLECACGEASGINYSFCSYNHTANNYYDEDGVYHYVDAYTCNNCGFRYQDDYTSERDSKTCTRIYYHNVIVNVGAQFVTNVSYVSTSIEHDYEITYALKDGATSCEQGAYVTYDCRDCEYYYTNNYSYHQQFEVERYNIQSATYGSALCEGYFYRKSCACGQYNSMDYSTLCHFGTYGVSCWIDNNVTGWIFTAEYPDHNIHISNNAYRLTCSVTDPEQCGYTARYTTYWLFAEDECKVYQYQTWQLGYNEETGTCAYEITFKTGNSYIAHPYVETSLNEHWDNGNMKVSGTRYDCPDCGSYYLVKYTYDENGNQLTYERLFENKLNDGRRKLYHRYEEYDNGNTVLQLYRYIDANDVETWSKYEYTRNNSYVGPFGDSGYEYEEKYSNNNTPEGEYEHIRQYAYVHYKGYQYYIYEYTFYTAYWEKYDYTYNFDGTCERTTHHYTSYGIDETNTETCHYGIHDVYSLYPTCTQDGYYDRVCSVCESNVDSNVKHNPYDHNWRHVATDFYVCTRCGIENINGASGDVVMEDLTNKYGNGENYVAGYWARNNVQFLYYVSIWLHEYDEWEDPQIVLFDIEVFELDDVRALAFSKSAAIAAAEVLGYAEGTYDVAISFVPIGADGSYDYSVIFTDNEIKNIDESTELGVVVPLYYHEEFVITPAVSGTWTFYTTDNSFDVYGELYDENGVQIAYNDDGGDGNNFYFTYELEAGKSYTIRVRPWSSGNSGYGTVTLHIVAPETV